jgi:hypothetical protein
VVGDALGPHLCNIALQFLRDKVDALAQAARDVVIGTERQDEAEAGDEGGARRRSSPRARSHR